MVMLFRCTMKLSNPTSEGISRCRAHTDALVEELELGVLWDDYDVVGDVVVISSFSLSFWFLCFLINCTSSLLQMTFHVPISTNYYHQIFSIKSLRESSRTILSLGLNSI
jgi:hypothetical protein